MLSRTVLSLVFGLALVLVSLILATFVSYAVPVRIKDGLQAESDVPRAGEVIDADRFHRQSALARERFQEALRNARPLSAVEVVNLSSVFPVVALLYVWALLIWRRNSLMMLYLVVAPAIAYFFFRFLSLSHAPFFLFLPLLIKWETRKAQVSERNWSSPTSRT